MGERDTRSEVPDQDLLQTAYLNFKNLINQFGQRPSGDLSTGDKTITLNIPSETNPYKHPDFISGRTIGSTTVSIHYIAVSEEGWLTLSKDSGRTVAIESSIVFEAHFISRKSHSNERKKGPEAKPDIHLLSDLIKKAILIKKGEQAAHIEEPLLTPERKNLRLNHARNLAALRSEELRIKRVKKK